MNGSADRVRELGLSLGFDAVGFTRACPLDEETAHRFGDWLARGRHASMDYMERNVEERLDPTRVLPSAKTVIVVIQNYYRPNPTEDQAGGKVARYAGGRDYHKVMRNALRAFSKRLESDFPGSETYYEVDTGPVLERYWAERAGSGWVGKNTLLITRGLGSWVFLGVILTSVEISPDLPGADHCGTCSRCIETCPTDAIVGPGELDSEKCISYWTIESREELSKEMVENLNGWFFGCDDCQTVCPWNRHAKPTTVSDYDLRPPFEAPDLVAWAKIAREDWDTLTRGTALRRTGYEGFVRNAKNLLR